MILCLLSAMSFSFNPAEKEWNKIKKSAKKIFDINNCQFDKIEISDGKESFFTISSNQKKVGYLLTSNANSKCQKFDFCILYDLNLSILKVQILKYRESHGFEICNQRWLKQFILIDTEDRFEYNSKIDGISGATISVNSIKNKVFSLTKRLEKNFENILDL